MVILHDAQDSANANGGRVQMSIDSTLAGVGTNVKVFDDRGARNASDGVSWYVCGLSPSPLLCALRWLSHNATS